jgi:hypothetical protein
MTFDQRHAAVEEVAATLMDWFPSLGGLECERIAVLAVAACDRHIIENDHNDGQADA